MMFRKTVEKLESPTEMKASANEEIDSRPKMRQEFGIHGHHWMRGYGPGMRGYGPAINYFKGAVHDCHLWLMFNQVSFR